MGLNTLQGDRWGQLERTDGHYEYALIQSFTRGRLVQPQPLLRTVQVRKP